MTKLLAGRYRWLLVALFVLIAVYLIASCPAYLTGRRIYGLFDQMHDSDPPVRRQAADALGKLRDERSVSVVIGALKSRKSRVREDAAFALGKMKDERAIGPLMTALRDPEGDVRSRAGRALGSIGGPAVAPLIAAFKDSDWKVRVSAAGGLGQSNDKRAFDTLVAGLRDRNAKVRGSAADALGNLRDKRAIGPLMAVLKDPDRQVTLAAADALGNISEPAVAPLISALREWAHQGSFPPVGFYEFIPEVRALTCIGRPAVGPLLALLSDPDSNVRQAAAGALGETTDKRAVEPLIAAMKSPNMSTRIAAARALEHIAIYQTSADVEDERAKEALLASKDLRIVVELYGFFIRAGEGGTRSILVDALEAFGNASMATSFLNCGDRGLESAGRAWAYRHGYRIETLRVASGSASGPSWGRRW